VGGQNSSPRFAYLLYGERVSNVTITGGGTVDGNGDTWWDMHVDYTKPGLFQVRYSSDVTVVGVNFQMSPWYNLHPYDSRGIRFHSVTIHNPPGAPHRWHRSRFLR